MLNISSGTRRTRVALHGVLVALSALGFSGLVSADAAPQRRVTIHGSWAFDVEDDRYLVGYATHVFFGRVTAMAPGMPDVSFPVLSADDELVLDHKDINVAVTPTTQYTVVPLGDIEGTLSADFSQVTLVQLGGTNSAGELELAEGDSLLSVGSSHLFITRQIDIPEPEPYIDPLLPGLCTLHQAAQQLCDLLQPPDGSTQAALVCAPPACVPPMPPAFRLIAPGYDHRPAESATDRVALETQYQNAYANQIEP